MSLNAYTKAQASAENSSETEYRLFAQVTRALMDAQETGATGTELMNALDWNRRMWSTLSTDCAAPGNQLPKETRAAIISLSIWVSKHTSLVARRKETVGPLIDINRSIMEGLALQAKNKATSAQESNSPTNVPAGGLTVG